MRIGIDMRMAGTGEGIARYAKELVTHLAALDYENEYFLLISENPKSQIPISNQIPNPNFQSIRVKSKYYSWAEQTLFVWELMRLKLDLVHFTSFNAPVFYPGKFAVTIHDIIHHQYPGGKKSRVFHRLAYRFVIWASVKRAGRIIAVSQKTKEDIVNSFRVPRDKISLIYEGVSENFKRGAESAEIQTIKNKYNITKPYIFFVGVWRQYKNLPRLALAFDILKEKYEKDCQLVLAGKMDSFYPEIKKSVFAARNAKDIIATGYVSDDDLPGLYKGAKVFVIPSLIEGFGLIGVEAQAAGTAVAASDIPVLNEVLGKGALYFNPNDEHDMAEKIDAILSNDELAANLSASGQENSKKYDWETAAKKTLEIYRQII